MGLEFQKNCTHSIPRRIKCFYRNPILNWRILERQSEGGYLKRYAMLILLMIY